MTQLKLTDFFVEAAAVTRHTLQNVVLLFTYSREVEYEIFLKLKICTFWSKRELLKFKEPRQEKLFACCFLLFLTVSLNYAHTKK